MNKDSIIGDHLQCPHKDHDLRIYTRTVVMWTYGMTIDVDQLCVSVSHDIKNSNFDPMEPCIRMLTSCEAQHGNLQKRIGRTPFRSVLSLDVQWMDLMPNLKISRRNTIQATGCQNFTAFGKILHFLVERYKGRGITLQDGNIHGFVGDIVLANVHFQVGWRIDRQKLRNDLNRQQGDMFLATYEPLLKDVSVTVKHSDAPPMPNNGRVYPKWSLQTQDWDVVSFGEVLRLAPQATLNHSPRCQTLRIFATGSVVQIGRWPGTMQAVHIAFCTYLNKSQRRILPDGVSPMRQLKMHCMWNMNTHSRPYRNKRTQRRRYRLLPQKNTLLYLRGDKIYDKNKP